MFTGLAEGLGRVKRIRRMQDQMEVCVSPLFDMSECNLGDSISISGVCLTVSRMEGDAVYMDVSGETLSRTTLGLLKQGDLVNLERAITALPVVVVFDNTDLARPFRLEAVYQSGTRIGL